MKKINEVLNGYLHKSGYVSKSRLMPVILYAECVPKLMNLGITKTEAQIAIGQWYLQ